MNANLHQALVGFIWNIANKLRGPYRPPQYRRVMLPLVVLRRLDLVLEATKDQVLAEYARLTAKGMKDAALDKALSRVAVGGERTQPLYNVSPFTFQKLLGDLFKNIRLPVPPSAEQKAIVDAVKLVVDQADLMVKRVSSAIEKLKEYRSDLITAAVTGKIDVRHFQAPEGESHAPAALS